MTIRRIATLFAFSVAALLGLGLVMLYSASMTQQGEAFLIKQAVFAAIGIAACFIAAAIDYRWLRTLVWPGLIISCLLLLWTWRMEKEVNGATRWIFFKQLGGFSFQSSELAKIVVVALLAHYACLYRDRMKEFNRGILIPGALAACPLLLVLAGKDFGTTMLLGLVVLLMLLVAGVRLAHLVPLGLAAFAIICALLMRNENRSTRIDAWLHPEKHMRTGAHQQIQSVYAIGSGGVTGVGLGSGRQKTGFIPEHHTDFIFSIIAEEFGLVATLGLLATYGLLCWCGLSSAWRASDLFGQLLVIGLTFMIGVQVFINIGVATMVLPNKGLSLPFISYGGSNLVMLMASAGLILSVARRATDKPLVIATRTDDNPFTALPRPA
ncbi:MAG: cell division protein FtsW [Verrucomicrobia bacterium]|nr:cell division protein FtsW [Verrucomicrobiota bacterium]